MAEVTEYYDRRENKHHQDEDEISLLDLYLVLARRKTTILTTLAVVLVISGVYAFLSPKVYQVSARLLPPSASQIFLTDIDGVKILLSRNNVKEDAQDTARVVVPAHTVKDIFNSLKETLQSDAAWNSFINKHPDWFVAEDQQTDSANTIENPLKFSTDKDFVGENILVTYDDQKRDHIVNILDQYLLETEKEFIAAQKRLTSQRVNFYIASLESEIQDSRAVARTQLADEILRLKDSLAIAKKLGILDNHLVTLKNPQSLTVVTSDLKTPDYMRGVKVLTAELEQLQNRTSSDPYIKGLRLKQNALQRLQSFKFTPETFHPLNLDGGISSPKRVKPKIKLILALGIVLGLMLGVFGAFFVEFLQKARSYKS